MLTDLLGGPAWMRSGGTKAVRAPTSGSLVGVAERRAPSASETTGPIISRVREIGRGGRAMAGGYCRSPGTGASLTTSK